MTITPQEFDAFVGFARPLIQDSGKDWSLAKIVEQWKLEAEDKKTQLARQRAFVKEARKRLEEAHNKYGTLRPSEEIIREIRDEMGEC